MLSFHMANLLVLHLQVGGILASRKHNSAVAQWAGVDIGHGEIGPARSQERKLIWKQVSMDGPTKRNRPDNV